MAQAGEELVRVLSCARSEHCGGAVVQDGDSTEAPVGLEDARLGKRRDANLSSRRREWETSAEVALQRGAGLGAGGRGCLLWMNEMTPAAENGPAHAPRGEAAPSPE